MRRLFMASNNGLSAVIRSHIATLGTNSRMNHLDLNVVSWFRNMPKLDLRYWTDDNRPDGKSGSITLTRDEAIRLRDALNSINLESDDGMLLSLGTPLTDNEQLATVRKEKASQAPTKSHTADSTLPW